MLAHAKSNQYAVGAFSAHNAETIQAILTASEKEHSPVMIQVGQRVIQYMGMEPMVRMIESFGARTEAQVAIHLDHGHSFEQAMQAIQLRFQSIMYDGSRHPLQVNIANTRKVVESAAALNIPVEGELGRIGGTEDDITVNEKEAMLTDPKEAVEFVESTGIDSLAVAIGTAHGLYQGKPELNFERLQEIASRVQIPLVLHGGSGVPDDMVKQAISYGIAKVNVDTELRQAFAKAAQACWQKEPEQYHLAVVLGEAREAVKAKVKEKIRLFGSEGRQI